MSRRSSQTEDNAEPEDDMATKFGTRALPHVLAIYPSTLGSLRWRGRAARPHEAAEAHCFTIFSVF